MALNTRFWLRVSLFNLLIVAFFGVIMRYKIGFEFPFLNQKHLQHGHSHFAFIGWVSHTLYVLMIGVLQKDKPNLNMSTYRRLLIANLLSAYGMLIAFTLQGYGAFSIAFSTLAVLISYTFAIAIFRDLRGLSDKVYSAWFTAALWFNIISSLGTFSLAFMMASHNFNQNIHLASLYFYLHFQYNGFFSFACMGLFLAPLQLSFTERRSYRVAFWLFFLACIPAYFLSTLWAKLPLWLYVLVVVSALVQVVAWFRFLWLSRSKIGSHLLEFRLAPYVFLILALALTLKYLLQLGSTVPSLSNLAFGFRPVVIAYLHLILLAIVSVFLLAYCYYHQLLRLSKTSIVALILFVVGVYLNELILGIQGLASFSYTRVPKANESLFFVSLLIFASLCLLIFSQRALKQKSQV